MERDARNRAELERAGWRVLVVWECELEDDTEATLERTARLIRAPSDDKPAVPPPPRRELLDTATEKVRMRVASQRAERVSADD